MRIVGRLGALVVGLIGVVVGLIVTIVAVLHGHLNGIETHGFVGFLLLLAGLVGSVIVVLAPMTAAVLLLIAGLGFFYVAGWAGVLVAIPFVLAAVLAYIDRRPATA